MPGMRQLWQTVAIVICTSAFTLTAYADPAVNSTSVFASRNEQTPHAATPTLSQPTPTKTTNTMAALNPVPPVLNIHGYYLQDVYSGKVLASQNPEQRMEPASLTKLMTLYIVFEALQAGRIHMNDMVTISQDAWQTGGSRMFVKVGDQVPVSDLINGVIIDSGNDACVALAEYVGGTEDGFVNLMNEQAQLLGMKNTHYMDCTGLPNPQHYTTPHDMAILARDMIVNFPQYYPLFSQKTFTFNKITQPNRNRLLWRDPSVDGLKTGHTDEAGFCLIASAQRNGMRLLSVLLGAPTDEARAEYSEQLLNYGYRFFETHKVYAANNAIEQVPVYLGDNSQLQVGVTNDLYITVPSGQFQNVAIQLHMTSPLKAPIKQGEKVGTIDAVLAGKEIATVDVVALNTIDKGSIAKRLVDRLKLMVSKA